jgi:phosphopantetheinyl transferase
MNAQNTVRIISTFNPNPWHHGIPSKPELSRNGPTVVVMSPLETGKDWHLFLDDEEASLISGIKNSTVKAAKLAAHVLLRVLLSQIDGVHPSLHSLSRDHLGRPTPRRLPGWSCSLSHDPCGVAVAVGMGFQRESHVGVDLCRPLVSSNGLTFVLHETEKQALKQDTKMKSVKLALYWASKEALLKRWGWGLIPNLDTISTVPGYDWVQMINAPPRAKPAMASAITSKVVWQGVAVSLAHHPNHVAEWWRTNAAELDNIAFAS